MEEKKPIEAEFDEVLGEKKENEEKRWRLGRKAYFTGATIGVVIIALVVGYLYFFAPDKLVQLRAPSGVLILQDPKTGYTMVMPKQMTPAYTTFCAGLSAKAATMGFDGILLGKVYTGPDGTLKFADFTGQNECKASSVVERMRDLSLRNVLAVVDNPDNRTIGFPVLEQTRGPLIVQEKDVRFAWILWKTGEKKIIFSSANCSGKIKGQDVDFSLDGMAGREAARASMVPIAPEKKEVKESNPTEKAVDTLMSRILGW